MEDYSEALAILDVNAKSCAIVDRTAIMETRGPSLPRLPSHIYLTHPTSSTTDQTEINRGKKRLENANRT